MLRTQASNYQMQIYKAGYKAIDMAFGPRERLAGPLPAPEFVHSQVSGKLKTSFRNWKTEGLTCRPGGLKGTQTRQVAHIQGGLRSPGHVMIAWYPH